MSKKNRAIPIFAVTTTMLSWALMSLLFIIFYLACLSPDRELLIQVDEYGEMRFEAILFAFIWAMTTINVVLVWKRESDKSK